MSTWSDWLKKKRYQESFDDVGNAVDKFKFNTSDDDVSDDHEHVQTELFKAVMDKYSDEAMRFLRGIAERGDQEIQYLLDSLEKGNKPKEFKDPQHPSEGDEVVPPGADGGHSDDDDGYGGE